MFPVNPKLVQACNREKLQLLLTETSCTPHTAKPQRYPPEKTVMIPSEVAKQKKAGTTGRSQSVWAAKCVVVGNKDGMVRVWQDNRGLNLLLESNGGGVEDIPQAYSTT